MSSSQNKKRVLNDADEEEECGGAVYSEGIEGMEEVIGEIEAHLAKAKKVLKRLQKLEDGDDEHEAAREVPRQGMFFHDIMEDMKETLCDFTKSRLD